ncbi:MAG: amidophosphoribosyltransferase [Desulfobacteraceae bacterium]|nr:MAG: amidophosphoribosyltransferase [Desulfobacteraceae bacterium]
MCGITGIAGRSQVSFELFEALGLLQHRGQDAAGIATIAGGKIIFRKATGLVRDVLRPVDLEKALGTLGIGHVRYPTAGCRAADEAQPLYVNSPYGIALAHNGNLTNAARLKKELFEVDRRHINTESDSEILLNIFAHELQKNSRPHLTARGIFKAVQGVHHRCRGGYAVVAMINGHGLVGFRDPNGIRPLVLGERLTPSGPEYMIASESCALDVLGFTHVRDIGAGEAVFIDMQGRLQQRRCWETVRLTPCLFEYVYLARPDSIIDGTSVYQARRRMGRRLAAKILRQWTPRDIDVVIPVPDTSLTSAFEMAAELGIAYREAFVKNRYISRTFIMPDQSQREVSVRRKLNPIGEVFRGRNVLLVDDSIVRGTTSKQIIRLAREAGANKVYFASAAAPVKYPNFYGIDMPSAEELIAHDHTEEEVAKLIGADRLFYQDLDDLIASAGEGNTQVQGFETSIFDGVYPAGRIDHAHDASQADTCCLAGSEPASNAMPA